MNSELNYEKMIFDITKVMAKYMNLMKKNEDILNELPLVKDLRAQISQYENTKKGDEMKILRKKIESLEKKQKIQACSCRKRSQTIYKILKAEKKYRMGTSVRQQENI